MKAKLTTALMLMLTPAMAEAGAPITIDSTTPYYQEGVEIIQLFANNSNVRFDKAACTRFYDSNKGGEWTVPYSDGTEGDSLMCWAHAASNAIQYWQTYYGVFYKGTRELPYGNIGTEPAYYGATEMLPNTKQLSVAKAYYENWDNGGGKVAPALDWYFKWDDSKSNGGYYAEYYGNAATARDSYVILYSQSAENQNNGETGTSNGYTPFADTRAGLTGAMADAFGLSKQTNNTYVQEEIGLLPTLSIRYDDYSTGSLLSYGHVITCYGFTTDAEGHIDTLIIADSDDDTSRMQRLYIKEENGRLHLYENADGTNAFSGKYWYISEIAFIDTPDSLKAMYNSYADTSNALVWNGGENALWQAQEATTQQLPEKATGWDVYVDAAEGHEGYYHSYAEAGRNVRFDAHGGGGDVLIQGEVCPGEIDIAEGRYRFMAGEEASLQGEGAVRIRQGAGLSSEVSLGERPIIVEAQGAFVYERDADTKTGTAQTEKNATIQYRNKSTDSDITYHADTLQSVQGHLLIGSADDAYATHLSSIGAAQLQSLTLFGSASLSTDGVIKVTEHLQSVAGIHAASTFSLREAIQSPTIDADLDLRETRAYTVAQAISLNGHQLMLSRTNAITLTLPYELAENTSFLLFDSLSGLRIDDELITQTTAFRAEDFFVGDYIRSDMQLIYTQTAEVGQLALVYYIPEPGTTTLGLLGLAGLATRRRR